MEMRDECVFLGNRLKMMLANYLGNDHNHDINSGNGHIKVKGRWKLG